MNLQSEFLRSIVSGLLVNVIWSLWQFALGDLTLVGLAAGSVGGLVVALATFSLLVVRRLARVERDERDTRKEIARVDRVLRPDHLRDVIDAAERHGFVVHRGEYAITFTAFDGSTHVSPANVNPGLGEVLARQQTLGELAALGLPMTRNTRGQPLPA